MRPTIRFIRKSRLVELTDVDPTTLLLDYLRETEGSTGTKEGCGEGDCGACTVALGRMRNGRLTYEPVNACILLLGQVDGAEVVTVEDLTAADGALHPIQREMVERHASQCGFCTPGFVMALFAMYQSTDGEVSREEVNDWIAGNLCRCTGYRPIVEAGVAACARGRHDRFRSGRDDMSGVLTFLADGEDVFVGDDKRFFAAPTNLDDLAALYEQYPDATIVAGGTDVGLWITKQLRDLKRIIHVGKVADFDRIEDTGPELVIGAGATYAQVEPWLAALDPDIGELLRRLGSKQVRASAPSAAMSPTARPSATRRRCSSRSTPRCRCARASAPAPCRSAISSSPTASRHASPANWSRRSPSPASPMSTSSAATR